MIKKIYTLFFALFLSGSIAFAGQPLKLVAHCGGREVGENVLEAFEESYRQGIPGYETDIRMTKDGVLVINHDSKLGRVCGRDDLAIETVTLEELMALPRKDGRSFMTLDTLLDFFEGKSGVYVEFEMKTRPYDLIPQSRMEEYCDKLYKAVTSRMPADADYVFSSGDVRPLKYMQQAFPGVKMMYITDDPVCDASIYICSKVLCVGQLAAKLDGTSRKAVEEAHRQGLRVNVYTGKTIDDAVLAAYLGADYHCTNVPYAVQDFFKKNNINQ